MADIKIMDKGKEVAANLAIALTPLALCFLLPISPLIGLAGSGLMGASMIKKEGK